MLHEAQKVVKVTAAGTKTVLDTTGYMVALVLSVASGGTLAITLEDRATPPNKLMPAVDLTPPGSGTGVVVKNWLAPKPVRMEGGIDIISTGTGEVYFWIFYLESEAAA